MERTFEEGELAGTPVGGGGGALNRRVHLLRTLKEREHCQAHTHTKERERERKR